MFKNQDLHARNQGNIQPYIRDVSSMACSFWLTFLPMLILHAAISLKFTIIGNSTSAVQLNTYLHLLLLNGEVVSQLAALNYLKVSDVKLIK